MISRRNFLSSSIALGAGLCAGKSVLNAMGSMEKQWFDISLAQWSLHRAFRAGELDPMDFAKISRDDYGIGAVEYVNQFYVDNFSMGLVKDLKSRAEGEGVRSVLIMCDRLGQLGDPEEAKRIETVENHKVWIDAAKELGCHSIRVNAGSRGTYDEQMELAADGLSRLTDVGAAVGINVIVENHGGLSSNGAWLAGVMKKVGKPMCGTLPDFGNFIIDRKTGESYDRYKGTTELMPYAKGVSAKSHDFDAAGNETGTDYERMMKIVYDAGYRGYIGVEYEGKELSESAGIKATKVLLERLGGVGV